MSLDNVRITHGPVRTGEPVVIMLPRPPSLNGFQRSTATGQRYSTSQYKAWQVEAGYALKAQNPHRFSGPVEIEILVEETARVSDIDNRVKPIMDLIVAMQIIPDDNQRFLRGFSAYWSTEITGAQVTIKEAA